MFSVSANLNPGRRQIRSPTAVSLVSDSIALIFHELKEVEGSKQIIIGYS